MHSLSFTEESCNEIGGKGVPTDRKQPFMTGCYRPEVDVLSDYLWVIHNFESTLHCL